MENQKSIALKVILQSKAEEVRQQLREWVHRNNILKPGEQIEFSLSIRKVPIIVQKNSPDIFSIPIESLKLSIRARKVCFYACRKAHTGNEGNWHYDRKERNSYTIEDLVQRSAADFSEVRNCGKVTLDEIRTRLAEFGLRFVDE